jgi:hypothetical protein
LCPQIKITPEVNSLDNGNCDLWVAVEVTGVLHKADGRRISPSLSGPSTSGTFWLLSRNSYKSNTAYRSEALRQTALY